MKKTIFAATALVLMGLSAQANTADEMTTVMTCHPLVARPDLGMQLTVTNGGYAGMTMIHITRFFLGHSSAETYIVRQASVNPHVLGAPVAYQGNDITLSVNFTTAPTKDGGHYGTLQLTQNNSTSNEELSCH